MNVKIGFPILKNDFLLNLQSKLVENNIKTQFLCISILKCLDIRNKVSNINHNCSLFTLTSYLVPNTKTEINYNINNIIWERDYLEPYIRGRRDRDGSWD